MTLWFTGLSGAGKTSLAAEVQTRLRRQGCATFLLDGDHMRQGLCSDLGFSQADRAENIRRAGEVARLMTDAGLIVLAAFISPDERQRQAVRARFAPGEFIEIFVSTPLATCEARDVKGLYRRARAGQLGDFTGISAPYDAPSAPEITVDTSGRTLQECAAQVLDHVMAIQGRRG